MSDLVAQLVGALERIAAIPNKMFGGDWDEITEARSIAEAALSAAKDGGWVAMPEVMTDEMRDAGNEWIGNRFLLNKAYAAMLAARPLPNPPKGEV